MKVGCWNHLNLRMIIEHTAERQVWILDRTRTIVGQTRELCNLVEGTQLNSTTRSIS